AVRRGRTAPPRASALRPPARACRPRACAPPRRRPSRSAATRRSRRRTSSRDGCRESSSAHARTRRIRNVEPIGSVLYAAGMAAGPQTVDEYLATFPDDVRAVLERVRAAIHAGVPDGEERMRYGIAAVMLGGRYAIHFAGWKHHVGLYPVPRFDGALEDEIAP